MNVHTFLQFKLEEKQKIIWEITKIKIALKLKNSNPTQSPDLACVSSKWRCCVQIELLSKASRCEPSAKSHRVKMWKQWGRKPKRWIYRNFSGICNTIARKKKYNRTQSIFHLLLHHQSFIRLTANIHMFAFFSINWIDGTVFPSWRWNLWFTVSESKSYN